MRTLALIVLLAAGAALVGVGIGHEFGRRPAAVPAPPSSSSPSPIGPSVSSFPSSPAGRTNLSSLAAAVAPGLVDINVSLGAENAQAAATGIVLDSSGELLTNNHIITGATTISASDVGNGQTYRATIVGYDRSADIAILQLSGAAGLKTAALGRSATVAVGDAVVALGNAGGTGGRPNAAAGAVVALNQQIVATDASGGASEQLSSLIEVNADVQPGDSGGPLVDNAAQVIDVDTAASAGLSFRSSGGQGYAIPINQALALAAQIETGHASVTVHIGATAFLGVELAPTTSQGGDDGSSQVAGAAVVGVLPGLPAAQAGLAAGDLITSLGGQAVDSPATLITVLGRYHPDDRVLLGWSDQSGEQHAATVHLVSGPAA